MKKSITFCFYASILAVSLLVCSCTVNDGSVSILYGNVITMKNQDDRAEAVVCKNGEIIYVGSRSEAEKYKTPSSEVLDYGSSYIYPGFMDAHVHGMGVATASVSFSLLDVAENPDATLDDYARKMKEFIDGAKGESRDYYKGSALIVTNTEPHRSILDKYIPDVPVIITTMDGHSVWVNTKAIEKFNIKDWTNRYSSDQLRVDENGYPTGYISENPAMAVGELTMPTPADMKNGLLQWQDYALSKGLTAVSDALVSAGTVDPDYYLELVADKEWKLRTYASYIINEQTSSDKLDEKLNEILRYKKANDNEYFKIIGIKLFMDGVVEAHTGWLLTEYADEKGYYGLKRITDRDRMKRIVEFSNRNDMNVHCHSIGDGATSFALDCIAEGQKAAGVTDARNTLAHLHFVAPEDIKRFAENNVIAVVAPLWVPKEPGVYEQTESYVGKEKAKTQYPVKAFLNAGAPISFHSDYPVSLNFDIPLTFYAAVTRTLPNLGQAGVCGEAEAISRYEALQAFTTGCAYSFKEENRLGTIENGKIANFTVLSQDLLNEDIEKIPSLKVVATIIDGNVVWSGNAE